jgi:DUF971 family protein
MTMEDRFTPTRLHLKKDEKLEIDWKDGRKCVYSVSLLRSMCPCAQCKTTRAQPSKLMILPGNYSGKLTAVGAEMVGNYAIRIDWSDEHGSGIYSFEYLREIAGPEAVPH